MTSPCHKSQTNLLLSQFQIKYFYQQIYTIVPVYFMCSRVFTDMTDCFNLVDISQPWARVVLISASACLLPSAVKWFISHCIVVFVYWCLLFMDSPTLPDRTLQTVWEMCGSWGSSWEAVPCSYYASCMNNDHIVSGSGSRADSYCRIVGLNSYSLSNKSFSPSLSGEFLTTSSFTALTHRCITILLP